MEMVKIIPSRKYTYTQNHISSRTDHTICVGRENIHWYYWPCGVSPSGELNVPLHVYHIHGLPGGLVLRANLSATLKLKAGSSHSFKVQRSVDTTCTCSPPMCASLLYMYMYNSIYMYT